MYVCVRESEGGGYLAPDAHCIRFTSEQQCKPSERGGVNRDLCSVKEGLATCSLEPGIRVAAK